MPERETVPSADPGGGAGGGRSGDGRLPVAVLCRERGVRRDAGGHGAGADSCDRGRLSPAAVQSLYGTRMGMSASRMDRVRQCHFGYFMQYGLRAKERRPAGFEAPEIGTFLHYLLENTAREVAGSGGWAAGEQRRSCDAMVRKYIDLYIRDEIPGLRGKERPVPLSVRPAAAPRRRTSWTAWRRSWRQSDFKPGGLRAGLRRTGRYTAGHHHPGGGRVPCSVSGKVDRVDGWLHDGKLYLRVVDYKTGRKSFDLSDVRYGLGIQMLLYLFTLEKEGAVLLRIPHRAGGGAVPPGTGS